MDFVNYAQTRMFIKILKIKQTIANNFVIVFGIRPNREMHIGRKFHHDIIF